MWAVAPQALRRAMACWPPHDKAQLTDGYSDFWPRTQDLALVINDLQTVPASGRLSDELRVYPRAKITVRILSGTVQLQLHEEGMRIRSRPRMSDGTLRYLSVDPAAPAPHGHREPRSGCTGHRGPPRTSWKRRRSSADRHDAL